jgi:hypothetical protein
VQTEKISDEIMDQLRASPENLSSDDDFEEFWEQQEIRRTGGIDFDAWMKDTFVDYCVPLLRDAMCLVIDPLVNIATGGMFGACRAARTLMQIGLDIHRRDPEQYCRELGIDRAHYVQPSQTHMRENYDLFRPEVEIDPTVAALCLEDRLKFAVVCTAWYIKLSRVLDQENQMRGDDPMDPKPAFAETMIKPTTHTFQGFVPNRAEEMQAPEIELWRIVIDLDTHDREQCDLKDFNDDIDKLLKYARQFLQSPLVQNRCVNVLEIARHGIRVYDMRKQPEFQYRSGRNTAYNELRARGAHLVFDTLFLPEDYDLIRHGLVRYLEQKCPEFFLPTAHFEIDSKFTNLRMPWSIRAKDFHGNYSLYSLYRVKYNQRLHCADREKGAWRYNEHTRNDIIRGDLTKTDILDVQYPQVYNPDQLRQFGFVSLFLLFNRLCIRCHVVTKKQLREYLPRMEMMQQTMRRIQERMPRLNALMSHDPDNNMDMISEDRTEEFKANIRKWNCGPFFEPVDAPWCQADCRTLGNRVIEGLTSEQLCNPEYVASRLEAVIVPYINQYFAILHKGTKVVQLRVETCADSNEYLPYPSMCSLGNSEIVYERINAMFTGIEWNCTEMTERGAKKKILTAAQIWRNSDWARRGSVLKFVFKSSELTGVNPKNGENEYISSYISMHHLIQRSYTPEEEEFIRFIFDYIKYKFCIPVDAQGPLNFVPKERQREKLCDPFLFKYFIGRFAGLLRDPSYYKAEQMLALIGKPGDGKTSLLREIMAPLYGGYYMESSNLTDVIGNHPISHQYAFFLIDEVDRGIENAPDSSGSLHGIIANSSVRINEKHEKHSQWVAMGLKSPTSYASTSETPRIFEGLYGADQDRRHFVLNSSSAFVNHEEFFAHLKTQCPGTGRYPLQILASYFMCSEFVTECCKLFKANNKEVVTMNNTYTRVQCFSPLYRFFFESLRQGKFNWCSSEALNRLDFVPFGDPLNTAGYYGRSSGSLLNQEVPGLFIEAANGWPLFVAVQDLYSLYAEYHNSIMSKQPRMKSQPAVNVETFRNTMTLMFGKLVSFEMAERAIKSSYMVDDPTDPTKRRRVDKSRHEQQEVVIFGRPTESPLADARRVFCENLRLGPLLWVCGLFTCYIPCPSEILQSIPKPTPHDYRNDLILPLNNTHSEICMGGPDFLMEIFGKICHSILIDDEVQAESLFQTVPNRIQLSDSLLFLKSTMAIILTRSELQIVILREECKQKAKINATHFKAMVQELSTIPLAIELLNKYKLLP